MLSDRKPVFYNRSNENGLKKNLMMNWYIFDEEVHILSAPIIHMPNKPCVLLLSPAFKLNTCMTNYLCIFPQSIVFMIYMISQSLLIQHLKETVLCAFKVTIGGLLQIVLFAYTKQMKRLEPNIYNQDRLVIQIIQILKE